MAVNKRSIASENHFNLIDLTGLSFGRLSVVSLSHTNLNGAYWRCLCECGASHVVLGKLLRNGKTNSCGCLRKETSRDKQFLHGEANSPTKEYEAYKNARSRCNNPKNIGFAHYGGRGIEFRFESFQAFLRELGRRPSPSHSLDRINNDGHYESGNVRWAVKAVQLMNRSVAKPVTFHGESKPVRQWAEEAHLHIGTVKSRMQTGWCIECALTIPAGGKPCPHRR